MTLLDESLINRAAPPGSMRYFSVLYAPEHTREAIFALYVIDAEIRESALRPDHDVAHTRLQWWRGEIDRLVNGSAQHPATRVLHQRGNVDPGSFGKLHELVVAADMDLARMTYSTLHELRAYCTRSGGVTQELIAAQLTAPGALEEPSRAAANRIGVGVRQSEMLRDLRQDANDGRVYLPLEHLDRYAIRIEDLRAREISAQVRQALVEFREAARAELAPAAASAQLRPVWVLAALYRRLLDRIAKRKYDVATERVELGPIEKPWVAWRAARKAS